MISGDYNFRTVDLLMNKRKANKGDMVAGLTKVLKIYRSNGFNVIQVSADNEFECVREAISPTFLNITATNEHVSEVERSIRTIKERARYQLSNLPYKYYPRMLAVGAVIFTVKSLNAECGVSKLSEELSPMTLITGIDTLSYNELMELSFGVL